MAFRQHAPPPQQTQRTYAPLSSSTQPQPQTTLQVPETQAQHIADVQEWVLFSPSSVISTTEYTASSTFSQSVSAAPIRTAGHSRASDYGSLHTATNRSGVYFDDASLEEEVIEEDEDEEEGEDGELDSLDEGLGEFGRGVPSIYRGTEVGEEERERGEMGVLPTHDGLGSFRIDRTGMGEDVQEHLYAFERWNPRRVKRRRESVEFAQGVLEGGTEEEERVKRIENWRLEQSRLLVDEIQKETRRRKMSVVSEKRSLGIGVGAEERELEDMATLSNVDSVIEEEGGGEEEHETFWNRITRRVIRDLIGIDDDILSIIFGEALPADDQLSTTPKQLNTIKNIIPLHEYAESGWEHRLLERIARELGILVNQLSDHPGAFSTYLKSQSTPLPYAGLPVIPESARSQTQTPVPDSNQQRRTSDSMISNQDFKPTLQTTTLPLSIPKPTTALAQPTPIMKDQDATPRAGNLLTQEEWERDLDLKMVFKYLRSRFTAKFLPNSPDLEGSSQTLPFTTTTGTSHLATASTSETAARAARVRQHHPLVSLRPNHERRRSIEKRTWKVSVPVNNGGGMAVLARRESSSCASERVSLNGRKRNSGSSRHYWDFGGSGSVGAGSVGVGAGGGGSLIASTGGMGSWGEV